MSDVQVRKEQTERSIGRLEPATPMFPLDRSINLSPFGWFREFKREMDRMFRGLPSSMDDRSWAPAMDVQQCNGTLTITAELAGLKKEELKVEVTEGALIIEGDRKREHKEDHEGFHRWERSYGHFYRSIPLPEGAKTDQVKAELSDGVLKVSLPVPEIKKNVRRITVETRSNERPTAA